MVGAIQAQGLVAAALVVCLLSLVTSETVARSLGKWQEEVHVTQASFLRSTRFLILAQHHLPPDQLRDQGPCADHPCGRKQDPSMTFAQLQFSSNQLRGQDLVHSYPSGRALPTGYGGQFGGDRLIAVSFKVDSRWSTAGLVYFSGGIGEGGASGRSQFVQAQHPSEGFVQQQ